MQTGNHRWPTVTFIAKDRAAQRCEVEANLMGAPGQRNGPYKGGLGELAAQHEAGMRSFYALAVRQHSPDL